MQTNDDTLPQPSDHAKKSNENKIIYQLERGTASEFENFSTGTAKETSQSRLKNINSKSTEAKRV
jgi:hypothetical protein